MAGPDPVVIQTNWEAYSYNSGEGPIFVSFYAGAKDLPRDDFPFCARVIIEIKQPNESGGPVGDEAERLWSLEDALTETLARHDARCLLLARLTHSGDRELVFQLSDWDRFRPPVGLWMQHASDYHIDVSEHDGWGFFDDFAWPSDEDWMLINDRRVIDGLVKAGSQPEAEHALEFVFMGDASTLQSMRNELESRGYEHYASPTPRDQLVMVKRLPLDLRRIFAESKENRRLCEEMGVEFDGWGAEVVK